MQIIQPMQSTQRAATGAPPTSTLVLVLLWVLGALALIGIPTLVFRLYRGLEVTHLGSVVPWGMWVACYIYFIGLSAGSFLLSTLIFVFKNEKLEPIGRLAVFQAFACLGTGLVFIWIDLGHWARFWHVFAYPHWGSVLAWEIWFYLIYIVILVAELWYLMRCDLSRWSEEATGLAKRVYRTVSLGFRCPETPDELAACNRQTQRWLTILGVIGIPIALAVHGGTGAIFAVVKARPAWYSPIFPLVFIISALASGGGLLLFLRAFVFPDPEKDRELLPFLAKLTGGFLVFDLVLLGLEFLVGFYGGIPDHVEAYHLIAFGPFWWIFWFQQLFFGALIPLLLIYARPEGASTARLGIAGLLIVIGVFGVRLNIVIPALAIPVFRGFDTAIDSMRLVSLYTPNWVEYFSSLGVVAVIALASYAVMRRLPMSEHQPYPHKS